MAIKFIEVTYEKLNGNNNHARVEMAVDSSSDLTTSHKGITFTQGSIAWDVSTGDFYGLDSSGTWHKQGGGDSSAETNETQQSNAASPNNAPLNLDLNSGLNRPTTLEEPKDITIAPTDEKADTDDSESVSDDVTEEIEETEEQPAETEEEPEVEEVVEDEQTEDIPDIDSGNIEEEPTEEEGE